jgi:chemotaxis protein methyltransferase CheR
MMESISASLIEQFSEFVAGHLGLHFPAERWPDLHRGILDAAREFGYRDPEACVRWLMSAPLSKAQIEVLAGNLTVGETYFFRESNVFDAMEREILPELIELRRSGDRRLRFWSAACCTGEEPYSLAILLHRLLPDHREWTVTILGTDVNPRFLRKAAQGVFGEWSFRETPAWVRDAYFTPLGSGKREIRPEIRRMVTFEHLNLAKDIYPSLLTDTNALDLIFCRNALMYFSPGHAAMVVDNLRRCLIDGGWLVVGTSEVSLAAGSGFSPVQSGGAMFLRKATAVSVRPGPPVAVSSAAAAPVVVDTRVHAAAGGGASARELANEGRLAEALVCANRLVATEKMNPGAHYLRALILLEQGQLQEASKALHRAIYLDQEFILAHFTLGNLARNAGRRREADRHFANALRSLRGCEATDLLPESDGLTVGRMAEIIAATRAEEAVA